MANMYYLLHWNYNLTVACIFKENSYKILSVLTVTQPCYDTIIMFNKDSRLFIHIYLLSIYQISLHPKVSIIDCLRKNTKAPSRQYVVAQAYHPLFVWCAVQL